MKPGITQHSLKKQTKNPVKSVKILLWPPLTRINEESVGTVIIQSKCQKKGRGHIQTVLMLEKAGK